MRRRWSANNIQRSKAAASVFSFIIVFLSLTLAVVQAVLFGVDKYERVPERTLDKGDVLYGQLQTV